MERSFRFGFWGFAVMKNSTLCLGKYQERENRKCSKSKRQEDPENPQQNQEKLCDKISPSRSAGCQYLPAHSGAELQGSQEDLVYYSM
jgi:hypothetical protein